MRWGRASANHISSSWDQVVSVLASSCPRRLHHPNYTLQLAPQTHAFFPKTDILTLNLFENAAESGTLHR
jgi:hypothetical protein